MLFASLCSIVVALGVTFIIIKALYDNSLKRSASFSKRDYLLNGAIVALVFFCLSSLVYIVLINYSF